MTYLKSRRQAWPHRLRLGSRLPLTEILRDLHFSKPFATIFHKSSHTRDMGKSQTKKKTRGERHNPMRVPDAHLGSGSAQGKADPVKERELLPVFNKVSCLRRWGHSGGT